MSLRRPSILSALCLLWVPAVGLGELYLSESWNVENPLELDPYPQVPHANGENLWAYWDESFVPVDEGEPWTGGNYHNEPMKWSGTGGVGDSGYAWAPLGELSAEVDETRAHWPAFLADQILTYYDHYYGVPPRDLDLTGNDLLIRASLLDQELVSTSVTPPGPVSLGGGKVHFFVGQWWHNDPEDPNDDAWAFFYNNNGHFEVDEAAEGWTTTAVPVGEGTGTAGDWGVIALSEEIEGVSQAPPADGDEAYEHFDSPQQWGFVIYNETASVEPIISGELGFDNFEIIPDPATLSLLTLGGLVVLKRRRT